MLLLPQIPAYPNTFQTAEEHNRTFTADRQMRFATHDSVGQVNDFYMKALTGDGWRQRGNGDFFRGSDPESKPDACLKLGVYSTRGSSEEVTHVVILLYKGDCDMIYPFPDGDM